jgi:hypothetical protein
METIDSMAEKSKNGPSAIGPHQLMELAKRLHDPLPMLILRSIKRHRDKEGWVKERSILDNCKSRYNSRARLRDAILSLVREDELETRRTGRTAEYRISATGKYCRWLF